MSPYLGSPDEDIPSKPVTELLQSTAATLSTSQRSSGPVAPTDAAFDNLFSPIFNLVWYACWALYQLAKTALYHVPSLIISLLSRTFQINLSVASVLAAFALLSVGAYFYVRYRYQTKYSRLPEDTKRQEPTMDTFLDSSQADTKTRGSYLDEFLRAIKIFGYLEKPVFHELTKSMQTQKLDSGEILFLDDTSGFTICVEGQIQVYFRLGSDSAQEDDLSKGAASFSRSDSKEVVLVDGVRYQLLNNIKSGAPVSSFISVLNLLTNKGNNTRTPSFLGTPPAPAMSGVPGMPAEVGVPPHLSLDGSTNSSPVELIAIPSGNCTVSIIPKESFARIAVKYPKATTHIIEMVLTKLYRVTFETAHNYLELTSHIFQTELNLNNSSTYKLSSHLRDVAIRSFSNGDDSAHDLVLRQRSITPLASEDGGDAAEEEDRDRSVVIHPSYKQQVQQQHQRDANSASSSARPRRMRKRRQRHRHPSRDRSGSSRPSGSDFSPCDAGEEDTSPIRASSAAPVTSRHFSLQARKSANPGDLLSNAPMPRPQDSGVDNHVPGSAPDSKELRERLLSGDESDTDDSTLLSSLSDAISTMIGIDPETLTYGSRSSRGSVSSNSIDSPLGLTAVNVIPTIEGRRSNLRSFSTTSMHSASMTADDDTAANRDRQGAHDYNAIKRDLADEIQIVKLPKGALIAESQEQTPGLYFVIDGALDVSYMKKESVDWEANQSVEKVQFHEEYLYTAGANELAGYLGTLIGSKSFVNIRASRTTYAAYIRREVFDFLIERYPRMESCIARQLLSVLDKRLYLTDYALEWIHSISGTSLYIQGDPANGIYVVLNGRMRAMRTETLGDGKERRLITGEYGQGESLGEVEVLTMTNRLTSLVAIRDSELARIPRTLFELIAISNPSIMVNVSRIVANRVKGMIVPEQTPNGSMNLTTRLKDEPLFESFTNFRTLTILPVNQGLPVTDFGERLGMALEAIGKDVKILNQSSTISSLGKHAFDRLAKLKQGGWFAEVEEKFDIVIYLADTMPNSSWTTTCIHQGDCILLLADATASPDVGEYERLLVKTRTSARTELVLLHPEKYVEPGLTNQWLKNRIWVHSYHHIQMQCHAKAGDASMTVGPEESIERIERSPSILMRSTEKFKMSLRSTMEDLVSRNELLMRLTRDSFKSTRYYQPMQEHKNDFLRLARILTGNAIGLVLGGGGARGLSHIGIIKALEDHGIPVDIIGGTSIGSFVGGLYAKSYDFVPLYGRAKTFSGRMSSLWRSVLDLTIPITSYVTGHEFNRGIWKAFGDSRIEDFWIKYYANSTNITEYLMEIHTSGYAWRYIRASMSLASLVPPITDNGSMLLDGGYIDNLTVSEMKRRGAKIVIACDVGSEDDRTPMDYGDSLSGWWVVLNRLNPFSPHPNVPTMADIQMRLAYVASVNNLDLAKQTEGCFYLRPPIDGYATLDFAKYDEIYRVGCNYGNAMLDKLQAENKLPTSKGKRQRIKAHTMTRRYSV